MYLELQNVSKKIKEDFVLNEINLSMECGKVYGLQGKNGCGKSMLMRVIIRSYPSYRRNCDN